MSNIIIIKGYVEGHFIFSKTTSHAISAVTKVEWANYNLVA